MNEARFIAFMYMGMSVQLWDGALAPLRSPFLMTCAVVFFVVAQSVRRP